LKKIHFICTLCSPLIYTDLIFGARIGERIREIKIVKLSLRLGTKKLRAPQTFRKMVSRTVPRTKKFSVILVISVLLGL
jgi:hypothetical protein